MIKTNEIRYLLEDIPASDGYATVPKGTLFYKDESDYMVYGYDREVITRKYPLQAVFSAPLRVGDMLMVTNPISTGNDYFPKDAIVVVESLKPHAYEYAEPYSPGMFTFVDFFKLELANDGKLSKMTEKDIHFGYIKDDFIKSDLGTEEVEQEEEVEEEKGEDDVQVNRHDDRDSHYLSAIQPIQYMEANLSKEKFMGFLLGNIMKYASRFGKKDDVREEARKLARYANWLSEVADGKKITI